jgi:hypothetical protein
VETGSAITWKYPSVVLAGDGSVGEFYSVALTNNCQQVSTRWWCVIVLGGGGYTTADSACALCEINNLGATSRTPERIGSVGFGRVAVLLLVAAAGYSI